MNVDSRRQPPKWSPTTRTQARQTGKTNTQRAKAKNRKRKQSVVYFWSCCWYQNTGSTGALTCHCNIYMSATRCCCLTHTYPWIHDEHQPSPKTGSWDLGTPGSGFGLSRQNLCVTIIQRNIMESAIVGNKDSPSDHFGFLDFPTVPVWEEIWIHCHCIRL